MKKKYSKKQILEAIKHWKNELKKMDESSSYRSPFCYDEEDGPITTVGDLKRILSNFEDSDVLVACGPDGDPVHSIKAIWNSDYECEMTGSESCDGNQCFIRIG